MRAAEVLTLPRARQGLVIRSCHSRRRSLLLDECLEQGRSLRGWDNEGMLAHLDLAVRLADAAGSGQAPVRARLELGNAHRIVERYHEAVDLFEQAAARLGPDCGSDEHFDLALYRVSHALAGDDWHSALLRLRPLIGVAEGSTAVRAYLQLVRTLTDIGEFAHASQVLSHALRRAERLRAYNLIVVGLSQQVRLLADMGRPDEAGLLYQECRPLYQAYCTPAELLAMEAVEAHLLAQAGDPATASRRLWRVTNRFLSTSWHSVRKAVDLGVDAIGFAVRAGEPAEAAAMATALGEAGSRRDVPPRLIRLLGHAERQGAADLLPRLCHELGRWQRMAFRAAD